MRAELYTRLKSLIADAVVIPKDRFAQLEDRTRGFLEDYEHSERARRQRPSQGEDQLSSLVDYVKERATAAGQSPEEAACSTVISALARAGLNINYSEIMAQVI